MDNISPSTISPEDISLPKRDPSGHKYTFGRAFIFAGSRGYTGACSLAANACERSGAGLTTLMVPESIYGIAAVKCDGSVVSPLPADTAGAFSVDAADQALSVLKKADACLIGPGMRTNAGSRALLEAVIKNARCPLVLDADALGICAIRPDLLASCSVPVIITPHEGEFKRLGGDLRDGRQKAAEDFVRDHPNTILILKGAGTLVCRRGETSINPTGSAALAKGGSGDVLAGMLCAFLAQGFEAYTAAKYAAYLHGLAGDIAAEDTGEYSLTPSDIIAAIPKAFKAFIK